MDKQFIISEIHRTALNGKALGQRGFAAATNIKPNQWLGKYWARWGDALAEAGYTQNEWTPALEESQIVENLLRLTRKLGKFPTKYEIGIERRSNASFPSYGPITRLGSRAELDDKLLERCRVHDEYSDLEEILRAIPTLEKAADAETSKRIGGSITDGYVYLVRGQNAYKIGSTRAPYRRVAEIVNNSANGAELLHLISTDDPEGIEDYWHRRFADKRIEGLNKQSGEWFRLTNEDVKIFKRRKTM